MDVSMYVFSIECSLVTHNGKTTLNIGKECYKLPFVFPIRTDQNKLLFDRMSNYVLKEIIEDRKVVKNEANFKLYYIELYERDFDNALHDFKQCVSVWGNSKLMEKIVIKAFFILLDISVKSYNKAYR